MSAQLDEDAEYAILAPPRSDSSRASSSRLSTPPSERDTPPPTKRRRIQPSNSQQVDLTSPVPTKDVRRKEDVISSQPSNIRTTLFTSSDPSNYLGRDRASKMYSSQGLPFDGGNDPGEPFPHFHSSQPKVHQKTYSSQSVGNIHKAVPSKKLGRKARKEGEKAVSSVQVGNGGFKTYDTKPLHALIQNPEKERSTKGFKSPALVSSKPRSKRAAAKSKTPTKDDRKPTNDAKFIKPPRPPSPQQKKSASPPIIVPQDLPSESGRGMTTSTKASHNAPIIDPTALESIKAKLNISVDLPTSSAAVSSEPSFRFDGEDDDSSSSLSSVREVEELDADELHEQWIRDHPPASPKTQCQICKEFISRLFVEEFANSAVLSVRQQQRLCKAHRVRSAEGTWKAKGYPSVDWTSFPQRLAKYDSALTDVLSGTTSSFYRNAYEDQVKAGGNRTLQQTLMSGSNSEDLKRGYYGTKGARMIMDHLMLRFAARIRRRAATDKLVSAAGVAGFVQAVLAPELVVMLVKDDMQVDEEQARVVLEESSEIGHLLNEEEDETIRDAGEDATWGDIIEREAVGGAVERKTVEILELD
ncbi:MAG: hypothetical protein LQ341_004567 [Variospora aurantia]|nr:MAG: hypothetical protein LQ341_004567 [Variospora aurantia]